MSPFSDLFYYTEHFECSACSYDCPLYLWAPLLSYSIVSSRARVHSQHSFIKISSGPPEATHKSYRPFYLIWYKLSSWPISIEENSAMDMNMQRIRWRARYVDWSYQWDCINSAGNFTMGGLIFSSGKSELGIKRDSFCVSALCRCES